MRRFFATVILTAVLLSGCTGAESFLSGVSEAPGLPEIPAESEKVRAVWLSYLDFDVILKGKSEKEYTENIEKFLDDITSIGCNRIIAQVRPFSDALYRSEIFPWSSCASGTQGVDPGFDPLEILINASHRRGIATEAWVNPFRVSNSPDISRLSADNPAREWLGDGEKAVILPGSIYCNPASPEVCSLIIDGIVEIVKNYDVDGIHFDDYFYPDPDESFDSGYYAEYLASHKEDPLSLGDWRRKNISDFIKNVHDAIKAVKPSVIFGISPQGNDKNNYDGQYIDIPFIASHEGYVDYIAPQIYFGFEHGSKPFVETVKYFSSVKADGVKLIIGLAAHKIGREDLYAGSGRLEWTENSDILARQIAFVNDSDITSGYILFRYGSLFLPSDEVSESVFCETENIRKTLM